MTMINLHIQHTLCEAFFYPPVARESLAWERWFLLEHICVSISSS